MNQFEWITTDPDKMNGQPCIRGIRITFARVLKLLATDTTAASSFWTTRIWRKKTFARHWNMLQPW